VAGARASIAAAGPSKAVVRCSSRPIRSPGDGAAKVVWAGSSARASDWAAGTSDCGSWVPRDRLMMRSRRLAGYWPADLRGSGRRRHIGGTGGNRYSCQAYQQGRPAIPGTAPAIPADQFEVVSHGHYHRASGVSSASRKSPENPEEFVLDADESRRPLKTKSVSP
jgi:hypothetical protein